MKLTACKIGQEVYTGVNLRYGGKQWGTIAGVMGDFDAALGIPAGSVRVRLPCGQLRWIQHHELKRKK